MLLLLSNSPTLFEVLVAFRLEKHPEGTVAAAISYTAGQTGVTYAALYPFVNDLLRQGCIRAWAP